MDEMPQKDLQIDFSLRGTLGGVEITPATIGLHRFNEFNQQVEAFIAGSEGLRLDGVQVRVGKGSYKLTVILNVLAAAALKPDLVALQRPDSLAEIDPKRAEIVAKWQARSKATPEISYAIRPEVASLGQPRGE